jgi:DEAD/DEAH box helicase domain-containing protein
MVDESPLIPDLLRAVMGAMPVGDPRSVVASIRIPARDADYSPLPEGLQTSLAQALARHGIDRLYSHQREAWDAVEAGRDIVVVTATASGKTLCFNLPVLSRSLADRSTRALYFYPTKALANDQFGALSELLQGVDDPPTVAVFHGDLPADDRVAVLRNPPNIMLATPDIVHFQHLPKHPLWAPWWSRLRFVVLDEVHTYRGVFGSHIAHVMRRVRRVAEHYGATPQFIATSATIGNAGEHVSALVGRKVAEITQDGSPQVARDVVLWEPLLVVAGEVVAHTASERQASLLFAASVKSGRNAIAFARSRRTVERMKRHATKLLTDAGDSSLAHAIASYRAGLDVSRRKAIEKALRTGTMKGVVATNALELGIDIGYLDIAVLSSYPGSTMSFRQQAGRAGRRGRDALVVMVTSQNPLDQYIADHPTDLVASAPERATTDLSNPRIATAQLGCAARELPFGPSDRALYGDFLDGQVEAMVDEQHLVQHGSHYQAGWRAARPAQANLRSIEGAPFVLLDAGRRIGEIDARYVPREAHSGAIYLHDGDAYRVVAVNERAREVHVRESSEGVLTEPIGERYIDVSESKANGVGPGGLGLQLAKLHVSSQYGRYLEVDEATRRPRGRPIAIDPPARLDLWTEGVVMTGGPLTPLAVLHSLEHLLRAMAPLVVLCDPSDLEGHTDLEGTGAAYVYDRHEGGVGLAQKLFEGIDIVIAACRERLASCGCDAGCPRCVQSFSCLHDNEAIDKVGLQRLIGGSAPPAAIRGPDSGQPPSPSARSRGSHQQSTDVGHAAGPSGGHQGSEGSWVNEREVPHHGDLAGRRVRHVAFGEGVVTKSDEIVPGKPTLTITFADAPRMVTLGFGLLDFWADDGGGSGARTRRPDEPPRLDPLWCEEHQKSFKTPRGYEWHVANIRHGRWDG